MVDAVALIDPVTRLCKHFGIQSIEDIYSLDPDQIEAIEKILAPPADDILKTYCPQIPWPKQKAFLDLTCREALFGGAAGPGKSSALLMAALQYVHVPKYSALILRRDFARLSLPGSIMDRAREWLTHTDARWNSQTKAWTFPSGAVLQFGYIDSPEDRYRYASSEYCAILWDELTEFQLPDDETNPYLFMFSRLRKTKDNPAPLRMWAATNPGGIGHNFVRRRFVPDYINPDKIVHFTREDRAYVPALLPDNPAISPDDYLPSLAHLPHVTRERLLNGDWSVRVDGVIPADQVRYASKSSDGQLLVLSDTGTVIAGWPEHHSYRFATCDPAGTSQDRVQASRGKGHSHSVIAIFDRAPVHIGRYLVVREIWRKRVAFPDLCQALRDLHRQWGLTRIRIENEKLGLAAVDVLRNELPIDCVPTGGKDKLTRSGPLQLMFERGEIYFEKAPWTDQAVNEVIGWTGHPDEEADVVDALSYGALESGGVGRGQIDPSLFDSVYNWTDIDRVHDVVAGIRCADPTELGSQSALVILGFKGDGRVYVDAWIGHYSLEELCAKVVDANRAMGREIGAIVCHADDAASLPLYWLTYFRQCNCDPDVFIIDPKEVPEATLEAMRDQVLTKAFRWRANSPGSQALVNFLKSYPHQLDDRPLEAFSLALCGALAAVD